MKPLVEAAINIEVLAPILIVLFCPWLPLMAMNGFFELTALF